MRVLVMLVQAPTHPQDIAPQFVPLDVVKLLSDACGILPVEVERVWAAVKDAIWMCDLLNDKAIQAIFREHGTDKGFPSQRTLWPPSHDCENPRCNRKGSGRKLQVAEQRRGVLYTLGAGPLPVWSIHLECKECSTTYHVDYSVKGNKRHYYDTRSDVLQIGEHQFAEVALIQSWKYDINIAWVSAANCANGYKLSHHDQVVNNFPADWPFSIAPSGANVSDAFTLLSLLQHCDRILTTLTLPHDGLQSNRFKKAIQWRNGYIEEHGQPMRNHACTGCVRIYPPEEDRGA
ncbi:hypothetical protein BKA70DRAFT_1127538 [Coprinopsis sp. MPI-PUGE-AT-0042]|nr:hypothetical protein BKA70DRAFT_1127538 [Coprinopsis sp. MPI-PUGE-AT-0042]